MFLKVQILLPLPHSLFSRLPSLLPVPQASFPIPCSPGFLPRSLFSRTSPTGPITLTLSQPASHQHPSAQPLEGALMWSSCPVPPWLPPPIPKPFPSLTALISFTVGGESQPDSGHADTPLSTPCNLYPSRENVPGGWLGKNRCEGTSLQHSARGEAETHGAPGL